MQPITINMLVKSDIAQRAGINNSPSKEIATRLLVVVAALNKIQHELGQELIVNSGYRCPELNKLIPGSASDSAHCLGYAADFHASGVSVIYLCRFVQSQIKPFDQIIYEYDSWCHLSLDPQCRGELLTKRTGKPYQLGLWP